MSIDQKKSRKPVRAAGGIVMRTGSEPLFAVVQMQKFDAWVLPKGKLNRNETAIDAARREVLEETGYEVSVHEFAGTLAYEVGGRPKIVQFWRMEALSDEPTHELMDDIRSVRWLPLDKAVDILTHLREREFLHSVGTFMRPVAAPAQGAAPMQQTPADCAVAAAGPSQTGRDPVPSVLAGRTGWCSVLADTARGWLRRIRPARAQG